MIVKKKFRSTSGQVLIFVSLAIVMLGLFVGLAADAGTAYLMRARLSKMVDAAAIAGARAVESGEDIAKAAACDSAHVNSSAVGLSAGVCPTGVVVDTVPIPNTDPPQIGVKVSATMPMGTSFMRLGTLIGCGTSCQTLNIAASAIAAPGASFSDVAQVLDDTASMKEPKSNPKIEKAKEGAQAVVDMFLSSTGSSASKVALVPFRGCYSPANASNKDDGCIDVNDIVNLTDDKTPLTNGISKLKGKGGSGTNVCLGLDQGSKTLKGPGSRPKAKKFLVILTDAENRLDNQVSQVPECNVGNEGSAVELDRKTFSKATEIKDTMDVEIFVIDYGTSSNSKAGCNTGLLKGNSSNPHNLAKCIASADTSYPHYFAAPTPEDIKKSFIIIGNLILELRLTN